MRWGQERTFRQLHLVFPTIAGRSHRTFRFPQPPRGDRLSTERAEPFGRVAGVFLIEAGPEQFKLQVLEL